MKKILLALVFVALLVSVNAATTSAETVAQMRLRIVQQYIDKYNLNVTCDNACADARLHNGNDWLVPLAAQLHIDLRTLVRASIGHAIDWGFDFENLYGRSPSIYDWIEAYPNINERFRYELSATPELYRINRWSEERVYRYKLEYGGDF